MVAQATVVGDVRVSHQITIRADDGRRPGLRAAMNRYAFAYRTAVADAHMAFAIREGEVLRFAADDRAFINHIVRAERREAFNAGVGANLRALADDCLAFDDRIGAEGDAFAEPRAVADNGCQVNLHGESD